MPNATEVALDAAVLLPIDRGPASSGSVRLTITDDAVELGNLRLYDVDAEALVEIAPSVAGESLVSLNPAAPLQPLTEYRVELEIGDPDNRSTLMTFTTGDSTLDEGRPAAPETTAQSETQHFEDPGSTCGELIKRVGFDLGLDEDAVFVAVTDVDDGDERGPWLELLPNSETAYASTYTNNCNIPWPTDGETATFYFASINASGLRSTWTQVDVDVGPLQPAAPFGLSCAATSTPDGVGLGLVFAIFWSSRRRRR